VNFDHVCRFPVVIIYDSDIVVYELKDDLMVCRMSDLKAADQGRYAPGTIIDFNSIAWQMIGAEKAHAIGRFFGFNVFLDQRIRVRLKFAEGPKAANIEWIRTEIVKRLQRKDAFTLVLKIGVTTIELDEARTLIPKVELASSAAEIISVLIAADFPERKQWESTPIR
jgi:hypothetical protein